MDTTGGALSVTLPMASASKYLRLVILNGGANTLTLIGTVSTVVNPTLAQNKAIELYCDGVVYWRIGGVV